VADMMNDKGSMGPAAMEPKEMVDQMLSSEGQAKLAPLKAVVDEMGFTMKPEELLIIAQKDDRTAGKSPAELADMLRADDTLYDDLEAMASGKMDQMKAEMGAMPKPPPEEPTPGNDMGGGLSGAGSGAM
jgi:hypothetical protein